MTRARHLLSGLLVVGGAVCAGLAVAAPASQDAAGSARVALAVAALGYVALAFDLLRGGRVPWAAVLALGAAGAAVADLAAGGSDAALVVRAVLAGGVAATLRARSVPQRAVAAPAVAALVAASSAVALADVAAPLVLAVASRLTRARRRVVAALVRDLDGAVDAAALREALARALRDPDLVVAYRVEGGLADAAGAPVDPGPRACTPAGEGAVLVHDAERLRDRALVDAVSAAARLTLDRARLEAELRRRLAEVRASRTRIVEAGDAERRELERNLHDGAQQRLVSIALAVQMLRLRLDGDGGDGDVAPWLDRAEEHLRAALDEVREIGRGLHPPVLSEEGLGAALDALRSRTPVALRVGEVPADRLPPVVEQTVYLACREAAATAAAAVDVDLRTAEDGLTVRLRSRDWPRRDEVARGLADRVTALGGRIGAADGDGVEAWLPAEAAP